MQHFNENGILKYAQAVTELYFAFLRQVRDEPARGMDALDLVASMNKPASSKQVPCPFMLTLKYSHTKSFIS
jgi:hypothetical protein